jgi:hypothetical protein
MDQLVELGWLEVSRLRHAIKNSKPDANPAGEKL